MSRLPSTDVFDTARKRLDGENGCGRYWPVFLEWVSREWPEADRLDLDNDVVESLAAEQVTIYDPERVPLVFRDFDQDHFHQVERAIESRSSMYEDDDDFDPAGFEINDLF